MTTEFKHKWEKYQEDGSDLKTLDSTLFLIGRCDYCVQEEAFEHIIINCGK